MKLPWWFPFGSVPELSAVELGERLRGRPAPQLVDVRTPAEFAQGRVRGAINVPIGELRARLGALELDPARPVVAICLSGHRSVPAVRLLERGGFQASQLAGGMLAWRGARLPEVKG